MPISPHCLQVQQDLSSVVPQGGEVRIGGEQLLSELKSFIVKDTLLPLP